MKGTDRTCRRKLENRPLDIPDLWRLIAFHLPFGGLNNRRAISIARWRYRASRRAPSTRTCYNPGTCPRRCGHRDQGTPMRPRTCRRARRRQGKARSSRGPLRHPLFRAPKVPSDCPCCFCLPAERSGSCRECASSATLRFVRSYRVAFRGLFRRHRLSHRGFRAHGWRP